GSSKKVLSWIWAAQAALDSDEQELHESLRVEWARAKAQKNQWEEEVNIIREEMRRVLWYLQWETVGWDARANLPQDDVLAATEAGLKAYALRQADLHRSL
ncbi:hypothetical protein B0H19DRAFT_906707, partial [Mycena capillaripes]